MPELQRLFSVIKALRDPQTGCPWDLKQTHKTLLKYLLEESYEFITAAEEDDSKKMEEEIGDVFLQVLLHCAMAEEKKRFNLESVSKTLADKLIVRHPHVFDKKDQDTRLAPDEVLVNWKKIKEIEKQKAGIKEVSFLNQDLINFPALFAANKIGEKTKQIAFDWDNSNEVLKKVEEEWLEMNEELKKDHKENIKKIQEEIGDLLFSLAQLSRHLKINPEETLRMANKKFVNRFQAMEQLIKSQGSNWNDLTLEEKEKFWVQAKINEKQNV